MGNSCSGNCIYDCCDLNYNCATSYSNQFFIPPDNCYYFYYNYSWIYYTIASIICTIIFFVVLCLLCRRRRANLMLTQPMNTINTTTMSAGYDSSRNVYNGQQNAAYQQGYNMQPQPDYNQQYPNQQRPPSTHFS